jgi:hypothetical protein
MLTTPARGTSWILLPEWIVPVSGNDVLNEEMCF